MSAATLQPTSRQPAAYALPVPEAPQGALPRRVPEGSVPLMAFEGDAYDCGRAYGELVQERYPGYLTYLNQAAAWRALSPPVKRLFDQRAPYVPEIFRGLDDSLGARRPASPPSPSENGTHNGKDTSGCTSFGLSGSVTLDGQPISGQNKDVGVNAAARFIALRMRLKDAPTILVMAYPGEVWGFGLWSTGMSLYRTSLFSTADGAGDLSREQWGLLALASSSVEEALEIGQRHGIIGQGSHLITDKTGTTLTVEYNTGGVSPVWAKDGIATHSNHPEGELTARHAGMEWPFAERECSRFRMHGFWDILNAERGRLTPQSAMMALADHTYYPQSVCRHWVADKDSSETVSAAVAEPTRGLLHVVRGQPCSNWPVTYSI